MKLKSFLTISALAASVLIMAPAHAEDNSPENNNQAQAQLTQTFSNFFGGLKAGVIKIGDTVQQGGQKLSENTGVNTESVKSGTQKVGVFVGKTLQSAGKGLQNLSTPSTEQPKIEAASMNGSASQPATTPSLEEGFSSAKDKVSGLMSSLRKKMAENEQEYKNKQESKNIFQPN
jgi:hypothetical protein